MFGPWSCIFHRPTAQPGPGGPVGRSSDGRWAGRPGPAGHGRGGSGRQGAVGLFGIRKGWGRKMHDIDII